MPTKVHLVKAMVFPVVTYGCDSWTVKKADGRRIDAFELWSYLEIYDVNEGPSSQGYGFSCGHVWM